MRRQNDDGEMAADIARQKVAAATQKYANIANSRLHLGITASDDAQIQALSHFISKQ
jgi:hypothetical protein